MLRVAAPRPPTPRPPTPTPPPPPPPCPAQLEQENSKLRYQCLHLKRAVTEGDEKLAALQKQ